MSEATIHTRGYRRYDGQRSGLAGAIRVVVYHSWQRALGLKRRFWNKIVPLLVVAMAYVPGIGFVAIAALLPDELRPIGEEIVADYASYYGFIIAAIFLFAAFVTPELLCPDRRSGLLGLYLASPLTRRTYLLAKGIAAMTILGLVTFVPPFLLLIGYSMVGYGPSGVVEFIELVVRIFAAGLVISTLFSMIGLAISSTTDRTAVAMAAIIVTLVGSAAVTNLLVDEGGLPERIRAFNLMELPIELVNRIHDGGEIGWPSLSTGLLVSVYVAVVVGCAAWIWDRYRRLVVSR